MWEWSATVAQRTIETAWTRPAGEPAPTIVDPEVWTESASPGTGQGDGAGATMSDPVDEYADSADRILPSREYGLAG